MAGGRADAVGGRVQYLAIGLIAFIRKNDRQTRHCQPAPRLVERISGKGNGGCRMIDQNHCILGAKRRRCRKRAFAKKPAAPDHGGGHRSVLHQVACTNGTDGGDIRHHSKPEHSAKVIKQGGRDARAAIGRRDDPRQQNATGNCARQRRTDGNIAPFDDLDLESVDLVRVQPMAQIGA